jgi:type I restriction enzyme S subunit
MGSDIKTIPLGELCSKVLTGGTPLTKNKEFYENGRIPWLKTKEVNFNLITQTENYISTKGLEGSSAKLVPINSVIVAMYGQGDTAGRVAINKILVTTNQACCNLVIDPKKADYRFIYYYLKSSYAELVRRKTGSAQPNLNTGILKNFEVPNVKLNIQQEVGALLELFDNKININNQTNQTLEQMAQALFKSWFVDFDPVFDNLLAKADFKLENLESTSLPEELVKKAKIRLLALNDSALADKTKASLKALAQGSPPLSSSILPQHATTHAHFPNEFEHNEQLGWIPKGWGRGVSGELVDVRDGTHDSPKKSDEGFPLVTSRHITSGNLDLSTTYLISELDYQKVNERSNVENGDILLTMIGTVGIPYLVMDNPVNYAIKNVGLFRTSQNSNLKNYLHILLKSNYMQNYLNARVAGTTQKYLSLKVLRNLEFLLPAESVLDQFNTVINDISLKEKSNIEQNEHLTKLRDTLLPKLISGELKIPDEKTA